MITRIIVALNVLAFLWEIAVTGGGVLSMMGSNRADLALAPYLLVPQYVTQNHEYYRIVTAAFLHAGILHIFLNMLFFVSVNRFMEAVLGSARTLLIYVLSLLGAGVAVVLFSAPTSATLGASGAIFGMFGAMFAAGLKLGEPGRQLVRANLGILAFNLLWSFTVSGISWQGHVGGLVTGFVATSVIYWPPKPVYAQVADANTGAQYESQLEVPDDRERH